MVINKLMKDVINVHNETNNPEHAVPNNKSKVSNRARYF